MEAKWYPLGYSYPMPNHKCFFYHIGDDVFDKPPGIVEGFLGLSFINAKKQAHYSILDSKKRYWVPQFNCTHYAFEKPDEAPCMDNYFFNQFGVCKNPSSIQENIDRYCLIEFACVGDFWISGHSTLRSGSPVSIYGPFFKTKEEAIAHERQMLGILQLILF